MVADNRITTDSYVLEVIVKDHLKNGDSWGAIKQITSAVESGVICAQTGMVWVEYVRKWACQELLGLVR